MIAQANLLGEKLPLPHTLAEIKSVCCSSCFMAEETVCHCQCKGAYHGLGKQNHIQKETKATEKKLKSRPQKLLVETKNKMPAFLLGD